MTSNDERVQRYAEAIDLVDPVLPEHVRKVRAVMAVADAEQVELATRVEAALYEHPHCIGECGCAMKAVSAVLDGDA